jgi:hypothetical protein
MYDALNAATAAWSKRVLATVDACTGQHAKVDVDTLADALSQTAMWDGCPQAGLLCASAAPSYRRILLGDGKPRHYEALLILWPAGHATPIHDHDGLWGMEFVLDGVLEVESFQLSTQPALHLEHGHTLVMGVGDHVAFSDADYAHRCRNLSMRQQALSLHIYGGELNAYRSFRHDHGEWSSEHHRTVREAVSRA